MSSITFFKMWLVFYLYAVLVNCTGELFLPPGKQINLGWYLSMTLGLYLPYSAIGAYLTLKRNPTPWLMGALSLFLGIVVVERSQWLIKLATQFSGGALIGFVITIFYWSLAWFIPSYLINRYAARYFDNYQTIRDDRPWYKQGVVWLTILAVLFLTAAWILSSGFVAPRR